MKKITKQRLIYLRYILPPILMLLTPVLMLIPSYRFVLDGKADEPISAIELLKNSFELSRSVLFGTDAHTDAEMLFSKTLFTWITVSALLYVVAFAGALYCAITAMRYFLDDDEERAERCRTLFITLFPNRIVISVVEALILPLLAFPYIMIPIYKGILNTHVVPVICAPEPFIISIAWLIIIFLMSAVCVPFERRFGADVFKKCGKIEKSNTLSETEGENDYTPLFNVSAEDSVATADRNERIRQLLKKSKEDKDTYDE